MATPAEEIAAEMNKVRAIEASAASEVAVEAETKEKVQVEAGMVAIVNLKVTHEGTPEEIADQELRERKFSRQLLHWYV